MKNLSKALAAIIISAFVAAPASALAAKAEGWYAIEDGKEISLNLTMNLPAGKDNTKNVYACYYTPDAGKSEKDRWSRCGTKRDPRQSAPAKIESSTGPSTEASPSTTRPDIYQDSNGLWWVAGTRHPVGSYEHAGECKDGYCPWRAVSTQQPAFIPQPAYYAQYNTPYYYGGYSSSYYGSYYPGAYCCYSSYNSKPMSNTGKALLGVGAAALIAGFVVH